MPRFRGRPDGEDRGLVTLPAVEPQATSVAEAETEPSPASRLPAAAPEDALQALTVQVALFNERLEALLLRERPHRAAEERKETWVLLGALAVVAVFCFVAFYLNQTEVRDVATSLEEDIQKAGRTTVTSLERTLAALHLERLPEGQAGVEKLLRDKDRRDGEKFGQVLGELRGQSERGGQAYREDLKALGDQLAGLRQLSEEIHQLQLETRLAAAAAGRSTETAREGTETRASWATRAADGAPATSPPVPAARPPLGQGPGPAGSGRGEARP
jgi:hypothetical protein